MLMSLLYNISDAPTALSLRSERNEAKSYLAEADAWFMILTKPDVLNNSS